MPAADEDGTQATPPGGGITASTGTRPADHNPPGAAAVDSSQDQASPPGQDGATPWDAMDMDALESDDPLASDTPPKLGKRLSANNLQKQLTPLSDNS